MTFNNPVARTLAAEGRPDLADAVEKLHARSLASYRAWDKARCALRAIQSAPTAPAPVREAAAAGLASSDLPRRGRPSWPMQ